MKVGDYIRVDNGCICKVLDYTDISDNDFYVNTDSEYNVIYKSWIVKSSPNIIDLIEVGDYVNGFEVLRIDKECDLYPKTLKCQYPNNTDYFDIFNEDIKSIVTKEAFESMEYKVKE